MAALSADTNEPRKVKLVKFGGSPRNSPYNSKYGVILGQYCAFDRCIVTIRPIRKTKPVYEGGGTRQLNAHDSIIELNLDPAEAQRFWDETEVAGTAVVVFVSELRQKRQVLENITDPTSVNPGDVVEADGSVYVIIDRRLRPRPELTIAWLNKEPRIGNISRTILPLSWKKKRAFIGETEIRKVSFLGEATVAINTVIDRRFDFAPTVTVLSYDDGGYIGDRNVSAFYLKDFDWKF